MLKQIVRTPLRSGFIGVVIPVCLSTLALFTVLASAAPRYALIDYDNAGTFRTTDLVVDNKTTMAGQVQIGPTAPSTSQRVLITEGSASDTAQAWIQSDDVDHVGSLGNNEMIQLVVRNNTTFDTTTQSGHASGLDIVVDGQIATGSNSLENKAIAAIATCPGSNCSAWSFWSSAGTMQNDGAVNFRASPDVALGTKVENFAVVPQVPTTTTPQVDIGQTFSVDGYNLHTKNTATGAANAGYFAWLDTSVNSAVRGGLTVKQGTSAGGNNMGVIAADVGDPFAGSVSGEWSIYSEQGPIVFGADTSGFLSATRLTANNHWVQDTSTGTPSTDVACQSGTGEQAFGNDNTFSVTTGSTATSCVITFKKTWSIKPICTITPEGTAPLPQCVPAATAITCSAVTGGATYSFMCQGRPGST